MLHPLILGLNIVRTVVLVAGRVSSVPFLSEPWGSVQSGWALIASKMENGRAGTGLNDLLNKAVFSRKYMYGSIIHVRTQPGLYRITTFKI